MSENNEKRKVGRPRVETYLDPQWFDIIVESGKQGKHITDFLIKLGISYDTHYTLIKRNTKYAEAVREYNKFCEQWWYDKAYQSVADNTSNKFNQRLWAIIVSNKFRDNWREKQIDVTTQGDKLNDSKNIQIEIIKTKIEDGEIPE
jgi:hypothetical protein